MATLKDVAQKACVDVSTVSRALNNSSAFFSTSDNQYYNYYSMPYVITQALLSLTCRLMKLFITPDDMVNRFLL